MINNEALQLKTINLLRHLLRTYHINDNNSVIQEIKI